MGNHNGVMRNFEVTAQEVIVGDIVRHDGVSGVVSSTIVEETHVTVRFEAGGFIVFEFGEPLKIKRFTSQVNES